jgi:hypothetical protein
MRRLALVLLVLTGCDFYFNGDDDDQCGRTLEDVAIVANEYRDPQTGTCQSFGYPQQCDERCGPCPEYDQPAPPDWGSCYSKCEGLGETQCLGETGCFAAYTDFPTADQAPKFRGCWETAPSGPIHDGSCQALEAQECSRHDNCTAHYVDEHQDGTLTKFLYCQNETLPPQPVACPMLTTEAACAARTDCTPIYKGEDCTCTPASCDCQVLTYQRCQ